MTKCAHREIRYVQSELSSYINTTNKEDACRFKIFPTKREVAYTIKQIYDYKAMVLNLGSTDPLVVHGYISERPNLEGEKLQLYFHEPNLT